MIFWGWLVKLNSLLSINKKFILIFSLLITLGFILFFFFKLQISFQNEIFNPAIEIKKADITKPRFAINNSKQKIFVTAKEGNFIEDGKILLKNNVKFKSSKFSIESDNVTFDRKEQTAHSKNKSTFKSKNTIISSEGFNIYDNGNIINFYGNSVVILKWNFYYLF